ncbi:hypothetical protein [Thermaerobacillus caldiproteolyticus]|uniref:Uncharacterized protein n=1 Tax=Thermaerobacillus caldiproteolyticus TaxID=247480 RepID=A0A7V9Z6J4_9BACL|nr:hypothetical protein [Anoxybacillus caldiproteolyticus]MBA2874970.1 hypothetical protein [Anoxybacillus caldiproteolyticus]QPA31768.1 hypothetical protein ISX45_01775 [Anoxybacillus caldiproteolyticus]
MERKTTRTTDEEITLGLRKNNAPNQTNTTDEEVTLEFMYSGDNVTHQPKDYEDIEY